MTEPDLFVVCKNCSAEVSPYVTECPYCGQRVRKRAPKIERDGTPEAPSRRSRVPRLPRLRHDEIPGIAPDVAPRATFALIAVCLAVAVALRIDPLLLFDLGLVAPPDGEWWRLAVTPLLHDNLGYLFIAMLSLGIFGTPLDAYPAVGANGAALGVLCAWLVDDRRALKRGDDRENDLLGVYVIAAVLALVALAEPDASVVAAAGGAVAGSTCGLLLGLTRR